MVNPCPPRACASTRPREHRGWLALLAAALLLSNAAFAADPPVAAFNTEYRLKAAGFPFTVGATRSLTAAGDGTWKMEVLASNFLGEIRETSVFAWEGCVPVTRYYSYRRAGLGRVKTAELRIDATSGEATSERSKHDPYRYKTDGNATDDIALPLALQCMLLKGERAMTLAVADERGVETQRYQVEGKEAVEIDGKEVTATKVRRVRDDDSGRQTWLWFAPDHDFALVQLVQRNDDGRHVLTLENLP
ncbi:DUF3108 domain-containing protein [Alloalcanivorax sp. C16-1]|uniref:DUF3108 domain-containing protein n=1 Tax=Alloalcanivorax sp. C16-1 TaxID=3390051 RepID=UPI0039704EC6